MPAFFVILAVFAGFGTLLSVAVPGASVAAAFGGFAVCIFAYAVVDRLDEIVKLLKQHNVLVKAALPPVRVQAPAPVAQARPEGTVAAALPVKQENPVKSRVPEGGPPPKAGKWIIGFTIVVVVLLTSAALLGHQLTIENLTSASWWSRLISRSEASAPVAVLTPPAPIESAPHIGVATFWRVPTEHRWEGKATVTNRARVNGYRVVSIKCSWKNDGSVVDSTNGVVTYLAYGDSKLAEFVGPALRQPVTSVECDVLNAIEIP